MVIREADKGDLEKFLDLYVEFYNELRSLQGLTQHGRKDYSSDVERYLSLDKVFLAETGSGEVVGFIRVSEREGCFWIEELFVRPRHRGKGFGRKLVETAENYIRKHDSYSYIMVLPQDKRAMIFWLHMGYHVLNTIELAKNLEGKKAETRAIPLLSNILEIYRWAREDYAPHERKFLELVEEFKKRGGKGKELLEIFVKALEETLSRYRQDSKAETTSH